MRSESQADELTLVRERINALRSRERDLCSALIAGGEDVRLGQWSRVEVVERRVRIFDHNLLPQVLREDPLFWRDRVLTEVHCDRLGAGLMGADDAALIGMSLWN